MSHPPKRKISIANKPAGVSVFTDDGLILMEVGMVFNINGTENVCTVVDEKNKSAVIRSGIKDEDRTVLLGCRTDASRVLRKMDETWMQNFLSSNVRLNRIIHTVTADENQKQTKTTMSKKKSVGGKIAFVDAALLSGKYTKSEIAAALSKDFTVPAKTAKNTVSWAASTFGGDRHKDTPYEGKKSKHKPEVKEAKSEKPAKTTKLKASKAKAPDKKKSSAPKSKAPKKKAEKPAVKSEADNTQIIVPESVAEGK